MVPSMSGLLKLIAALGVEAVLVAFIVAGLTIYKAIQSGTNAKQGDSIADRPRERPNGRNLTAAPWAGSVTGNPAKKRPNVHHIVLTAGVIILLGSLISLLCGTLSAWVMGSGYVVTPGPPL
jgi:hypothetical protein